MGPTTPLVVFEVIVFPHGSQWTGLFAIIKKLVINWHLQGWEGGDFFRVFFMVLRENRVGGGGKISRHLYSLTGRPGKIDCFSPCSHSPPRPSPLPHESSTIGTQVLSITDLWMLNEDYALDNGSLQIETNHWWSWFIDWWNWLGSFNGARGEINKLFL